MNCFVSSMFLTGLAGPQQKAGICICLVQNNGENICAYIPWWRQNVNHGEISGTNQPSSESVIYCCLRPAFPSFLPSHCTEVKLAKIGWNFTESHKYTRLYISLFQFLVILAEFWSLFYTCNPIQTLTTAPCCLGFCADRRTLGTKDKCVSRK